MCVCRCVCGCVGVFVIDKMTVESSISLANRFRMYMSEFLYVFSWICSLAFMFACVCVYVFI